LESLLKFAIAEMKKASKIQADLQISNETNQKLQQELNALKKKYEGAQPLAISKPRLAATLEAPPNTGLASARSSGTINQSYIDKTNQVDARIKQVENEMAKNAEVLAMELNNLRVRLQGSTKGEALSTPSPSTVLSRSPSNSLLSRSPSNGLFKQQRSSTSPNSSVLEFSSSSAVPSLSLSTSFSPALDNFEKNWEPTYSNRASLSASNRIKAKKNMPVKHKETGEYRRPHMLAPMTSPPPT
jgi:regulator of replication initiation timing